MCVRAESRFRSPFGSASFYRQRRSKPQPLTWSCVSGSRAQYVAQFSSLLSEQYPYQQSGTFQTNRRTPPPSTWLGDLLREEEGK